MAFPTLLKTTKIVVIGQVHNFFLLKKKTLFKHQAFGQYFCRTFFSKFWGTTPTTYPGNSLEMLGFFFSINHPLPEVSEFDLQTKSSSESSKARIQ